MNAGMNQAHVLVVDNHAFTLATLHGALQGRGLNVQAAKSAREAIELADHEKFDVALLDLDLGVGPTGIDLAIELRNRNQSLGIIILTSYRDPRLAGHELQGIPRGGVYICKSDVTDVTQLVRVIQEVSNQPLASRKRTSFITGPTAELTDAQVEILVAVGSGATTREISVRRGVSESAVEQMLNRICDRLLIKKDGRFNQRVQLVQALNELRGQGVGDSNAH